MLDRLRTRVHEGPVFGTIVMIPSPTVVEALGSSPFPVLVIDSEHTPLSIEGLESMLRAADVGPKPAIVRVPEVGWYIPRVLDLGAAGIIVPRIETAEQAADVVARARYAPEGKRGAGPGRGQAYGANPGDFMTKANAEILVAIQIETATGLAAADEILATPGVDAVVIGPLDLATSLGTTIGSAEHVAAIDAIFAAADRHDVAKGAFLVGNHELAPYLAKGATLLFAGADIMSVLTGAHAAWADVTAAVAASDTEAGAA